MKIQSAGFSHIGTIRPKNQDAVLMYDEVFTSGLFNHETKDVSRYFIADGVGGSPSGDVASRFVLNEINQRIAIDAFPDPDEIRQIFQTINHELIDTGRKDMQTRGMATTLTGLWIKNDQFRLVNAGDSGVWLLRNGKLLRLTPLDLLFDKIPASPITNYFGGIVNQLELFISSPPGQLKSGDVFFVASDGIFHCFSTEHLEKVLENSKSLRQKAAFILNRSLSVGSPDNISCILIKISI